MLINEFHTFDVKDAVKFHNELNPKLFNPDKKMDPEVRDQLLVIAKDFVTELGIKDLDVDDVTVSGSNAAYSYTDHSDLDLHILVDFSKLPDDEVYQELFNAKKLVYNDTHDITVRGIPVELYVQDTNKPHISLGEYSIVNNKWLRVPTKDKSNFNQNSTKSKYEKLLKLIELTFTHRDLEQLNKVTDIIKRYRQAGLDTAGEFGPENLAYKALRKQGLIKKLYDLKSELHSKELSIEDYHPNAKPPGPEFPPTMPAGTVKVDVSDVYDWYKLGQHISNMKGLGKHDFGKGPPSTILSFGDEETEHKYIQDLMKTGLTTTDIDPKGHEPMKGQKVDPTYNVNEILDKESASNLTWNEGESNELYNTYIAIAKDKKNNILKYNFYEFPKYDLTAIEFSRAVGPWGDNYSIDKAGDQYTVFATLLQAIKNYLSSDKPEYIFFAAKEPSRVKLYQTFVNRFANQFGYKQISADNIPRAVSFTLYSSNDTPFLLQKVGSVKEVLDTKLGKTNKFVYHVTPTKNLKSIAKQGLTPAVGGRSSKISGEQKGIYVFPDKVSAEDAVMNWLGDEFDDEPLTMLKIDVSGLEKDITKGADYELVIDKTIEPNRIKKVKIDLGEASGYIPSEKEKNDPRFKTALTVDVKPDSIKKNAKAFGWKVSRAGIPPLLRK